MPKPPTLTVTGATYVPSKHHIKYWAEGPRGEISGILPASMLGRHTTIPEETMFEIAELLVGTEVKGVVEG